MNNKVQLSNLLKIIKPQQNDSQQAALNNNPSIFNNQNNQQLNFLPSQIGVDEAKLNQGIDNGLIDMIQKYKEEEPEEVIKESSEKNNQKREAVNNRKDGKALFYSPFDVIRKQEMRQFGGIGEEVPHYSWQTMDPEITEEEKANGVVGKSTVQLPSPRGIIESTFEDYHKDSYQYKDGSSLDNYYYNGQLVKQEEAQFDENCDPENPKAGDKKTVTEREFAQDGSFTESEKIYTYDSGTGMWVLLPKDNIMEYGFVGMRQVDPETGEEYWETDPRPVFDPDGNPITNKEEKDKVKENIKNHWWIPNYR